MPGGQGGNDIYSVDFDGSTWGTPENLGTAVNSKDNEVFPCYHGDKLYFSSDGRDTRGGLDLFVCAWKDDAFQKAENIGDPMNSPRDDFGLMFTSDDMGYFSSNRENGAGSDDIYRFQIKETVTVESDFVAGQFRYRNLDGGPASGLKVQLLDEDGNLVMNGETNEDGEFIFRHLGDMDGYRLRIEGEEDVELIIYDKNGQKVATLISDEKGEFVFKRLSEQYTGTMALIDPDDVKDGLGDLNGQFVYEHLPNQYASKLKVMLLDENGNIAFETETDEFGNFEFRNLDMSKNYMVRMQELDDDLTLLIFNKDDNITAILRRDGQGDFVFRRLNENFGGNMQKLELSNEDLLSDLQGSMHGQFEHKEKGLNFGSGLTFEVLDKDGNLVLQSVTDKDGFFRLAGLPLTESYILRIPSSDDHHDEDIHLTILNRKGQKVALLDKDKQGYFVYTPLGLSGAIDLTHMELENVDLSDLMKVPTIYYGKNIHTLDRDARKVLDKLVEDLKAYPDKRVEVNSYADSRASAEYNLALSGRRTNSVVQYLKRKGISSARLGGNAYGESKLLNDCGDGVDCPEELHRLNRRSEIRIY